MKRALAWYDLITVNIYWLGLSTISNTMTPLVIPLLVQQFVGEESKGSFYGTLRLWTLMTALLVQSLMGILSDHSTLRLGRRRPFILAGSLVDLLFMALIGFSAGLQGISGYWFLFAMIVLLAVSSNTAQAAQQGIIPDLVPEKKRGLYSGVKAILEIPLPLILVSFTIAKMISSGHMWLGILTAMGILTVAMLLTMFIPEQPISTPPSNLDWKPFLRLFLMAGMFTAIILAMGETVKFTGRLVASSASLPGSMVIMGVIGLLAMAVAIAFGVWISTRIGLGGAVKHSPSFPWWIVNRLAFLVGVTNLASFTVYFLQARLGFIREKAAGPASTLTMFVGIFILVSALPSGWLADRFGHKRLVAVSGFVAAFGTLIALLAPNLTMIYIGGCFIGAATGLFFAANWALGTSLVPKNQAGRYLGISNLAGAGAGAIGAYIGGPIADQITRQFPQAPGMGYYLLFVIYGLLFLCSVAALAGVHKPSEEVEQIAFVDRAVPGG